MSVTNTFDVADWISLESLRLLTNSLEIGSWFNTDYNSELTKEYPVGSTFRVPLPNNFLIRNGLPYTPGNIVARHTTVTCDQVFGVDIEWDSVEQALSLPRGEERVRTMILKPAMAKIRQEIDSRCANYATLNTPNIVGTLGTNPATFDAVYGAAGQRLTELAGNADEKAMILSPGLARAMRAAAVSYFNPPDEISRMFKKGAIGMANGFDTYESMSLYDHTAGVWQTPASVTVHGPGQTGSTLVVNCVTGDTFQPGNSFNIASVYELNPMTLRSTGTLKQFAVTNTSTVTGASSLATLSITPAIVTTGPYQNVDAGPADLAALILFPGTTTPSTGPKHGVNSLALTRDAFALVSVPLQNPKASSAEIVSQSRDPETGISIAFIRMFDPNARKMINRFDVLMGFGLLYNDKCSVRVLGA